MFSLYSNISSGTTTQRNTAVGRGSLQANQNGSNNTAVGYSALRCNTTGYTNTALGYGAGQCITTARQNVFIGRTQGVGFETQNCNIFISDGAGNIRIFATGSTGAVGVNTTSPQATLHVNGDTIISSSLFSSVQSGSLTTGTTLNTFTNTKCTICGNNATPPTENAQGNIAQTQIYNRALSSTEITQNYNAQKSRFGL